MNIKALDQNFIEPFLENQFSKIFEDFLIWRYLQRGLILLIKSRTKNKSFRLEVDVCEILKFVGF